MRERSPFRRWACNLPFFRWLWRSLYAQGWPPYDCEDCIGMASHGCYCSAMDAVGPCQEPETYHVWMRFLHGFLYPMTSPLWTRIDRA